MVLQVLESNLIPTGYLLVLLHQFVLIVVDRAIYFIPADGADGAIHRLEALDVSARGWRDKISVAWLIRDDSSVVSAVPNLPELVSRDFKIKETPPKPPMGSLPPLPRRASTTYSCSPARHARSWPRWKLPKCRIRATTRP